jgi:hypothetical protein
MITLERCGSIYLKEKTDVFNTFKQFRALVEKSTDRSIKCLRTDNGGEFTSVEFENYCKEAGIERHKTMVYTPQQNGVVERMNKTLLERARSMLSNAKLQQELWAEAVLTTCYLINRSPSTAINCKIPEEVWTGHSCDYSNLRIFGCDAYALISKDQRSKLDPRSKKYVFVGYGDGVKGYILWDPTSHKLIISRDVVFDESSLIKSDLVDVEVRQEHVPQVQQIQLETQPSSEKEEHEEVPEEEDEDAENIQETVDMPQPSLRRSTRVRNPPTRYDDYVSSVALVSNDGEPSCYQEAMKVSESVKWKEAMKEEMDALERNKTWDLVELPKDRKVVGCKWVYKLKKGVDDKVERYKARLVEKGYSQKEGIDFHEIFSLSRVHQQIPNYRPFRQHLRSR